MSEALRVMWPEGGPSPNQLKDIVSASSAGVGICSLQVSSAEDAHHALTALGILLTRDAAVNVVGGPSLTEEVKTWRRGCAVGDAPSPSCVAVCVATYWRADGSTARHLARVREMLLSQSDTDWHLILVGDCYAKSEELSEFAATMLGKCTVGNLPVACERDYITEHHQRWCLAGGTAMNTALRLAKEWAFEIYAHLDDDDVWSDDHVSALRRGYTSDAGANVCYTSGRLSSGVVLPSVSRPLPMPCDTLHACVSWRIGSDHATSAYSYDLSHTGTPADARMWQRFMKDPLVRGVHSNVVTVSKSNDC